MCGCIVCCVMSFQKIKIYLWMIKDDKGSHPTGIKPSSSNAYSDGLPSSYCSLCSLQNVIDHFPCIEGLCIVIISESLR